jgi:hypothetical protein
VVCILSLPVRTIRIERLRRCVIFDVEGDWSRRLAAFAQTKATSQRA